MKTKLLILVLAAQTAWLLGITVVHERALAAPQVILLETERIDPRDPLRGDFLILNYKISNVSRRLFLPPLRSDLSSGQDVFVAVAPGPDGFYAATRASTEKFAPAASEILLRGKVVNPGWSGPDFIHVDYGIERYYVAEGAGSPQGKLTVEAAVGSSGQAVIKQVFVDGKPYTEVVKPQR